jgi:anaerobic magnesium-protoporphyrin IX monomethyl ester cyclase
VTDVVLVQLPSPPRQNVFREWSGGMGTSLPSSRVEYGHDQQYYDIPFSSFLYIARQLETFHVKYKYVDYQAKPIFDENSYISFLKTENPKIVVAVVNLPSFSSDLALLRKAAEAVPGLRIILIGPTAKWFKEDVLARGEADIIIEEGEELFVAENIQAMLAGSGDMSLQACSIFHNGRVETLTAKSPMKDLSFVDFPAYELLDFSRYISDYYADESVPYAPVFTTKGCPYNCAYCPYPFGFGAKVIYRAPEIVGQDIQRLYDDFGVQQILFRDQVFTLNPKHARAVCQEIIDRNLDIVWVCETRYDVISEDMLDIMYLSGCREIHYGLESADPEMFANVAKPDGQGSLEHFERVIAWTKQRGIKTHVHLIIGMPDESKKTLRNTRNWLRMVQPDSVQLAYFMPYPGTPYFEQLKDDASLGDIGS